AYIEWFTPFRNTASENGLFQISKSSRANRRNAEVVPLHDIVSSCHLIPKFGNLADPLWTSGNV
ncbi:hypothetical protein SCHPADRAFT_795210, partial [Schizopora paradoxa]